MPAPIISVQVPDVYGQKEQVQAAAEAIARLIGDQPQAWQVAISEPVDQSGWLVEVTAPDKKWALIFDGPEDQTLETIVRQFRLDLMLAELVP